jgi:hypothetical protein
MLPTVIGSLNFMFGWTEPESITQGLGTALAMVRGKAMLFLEVANAPSKIIKTVYLIEILPN